jgi:hypothetical protein
MVGHDCAFCIINIFASEHIVWLRYSAEAVDSYSISISL